MTEPSKSIVLVLLHTTHYLSIAVWVGVMLFNLIVNFPALRARARSVTDYAAGMAAQGKRAGPWLYILVFLTLASGWALTLIQGSGPITDVSQLTLTKNALLFLMLAAHLWGTFRIWPRIYFALENELPTLLFQYQITIVLSSLFGIAAIVLTFVWRFFPTFK